MERSETTPLHWTTYLTHAVHTMRQENSDPTEYMTQDAEAVPEARRLGN